MRHDVEINGGIKPFNEIPAFRGPVMVDDRRRDVLHIKTQRIAEEKDQQEREGEGEVKAPKIPDKVIIFRAGNRLDIAKRHRFFPPTSWMKASFKSASSRSGKSLETISRGCPSDTIFP